MILYQGQTYENKDQEALLNRLYEDCLKTLSRGEALDSEKVIKACDRLYKRVMDHEFDEIVLPLLKMADIPYPLFEEMAKMFSGDGLRKKMEFELGKDYRNLEDLPSGTKRKYAPLGILFHISAGNIDVLPAYTVIEGLLAGNINVLKLPSGDSGMSVKLLGELLKEEPSLKEYIYVFDVPSTELESIKKLASIADGVVVWGGDKAVEAARKLTPINAKIIPWGHKLSFAYVGPNAKDEDLHELARSICVSNQVLCSSCQGLYYHDKDGLVEFGEKFLTILIEESNRLGEIDLGMAGRNTILYYAASLEEDNHDVVLNKGGVSVVIKPDQELELSNMFRSVWLKALPKEDIVKTLKKHKNHLQSAALICGEKEKEELAALLSSSGVVRITKGNPSRMFLGEAHDGSYALREYSRIVEID